MENATKALLIAAAVLIVVLLIVFGVRIFNSAQQAGDTTQIDSSIETGITNATTQIQTDVQTYLSK